MSPATIVVLAVLLALAGLALWYLVRNRKKGGACAGCHAAQGDGGCPGCSTASGGCNCGGADSPSQ